MAPQIVIGTDSPIPWVKKPVDHVLETPGLTDEERIAILGGTAAKLLKQKPGYANYYFNEVERDKLLAAAKKHGDFSAVAGAWVAEGNYDQGERKGQMRFEVSEKQDDPFVSLRLNIDHGLHPLSKDTTLRELAALLRGAPFRVRLVDDILPFKYTKLM